MAAILNGRNHVAKNLSVFARIRLGEISDVPHIHKLIYQLAVFERFEHLFEATEKSLSATLFKSLPFQSVTCFILEVSQHPFPQDKHSKNLHYTPIVKTVDLQEPIKDLDSNVFKVGNLDSDFDGHDIVVVGWVIFFPNYPAFLAKQGFHVDNLFVREFYRGIGFGKMLLSAVATQAVKLGFCRVDWICLKWNQKAIKFYEEGIGAEVMNEWGVCRLVGKALEAYGGN
ncbi:hypothetical protein C5167_004222 [Papaver somniferum]|uniref:L-ornithine N5-acetyltransferase NATA1-like n=1 Tax=Papaver somniferum TaxID=3469 RepID=UPI000E6F5EEC|nr:L-ornithine N5-acetyltransferase NATA1-like [Papaver somniferum]RZC88044.1 hypothetical protein C5167_004222 [Papaver somniferum]